MKGHASYTITMIILLVTLIAFPGLHQVIPSSKADQLGELALRRGNATRIIVGLRDCKHAISPTLDEIVIEHLGKIVDVVSMQGHNIALVVELPLSFASDFLQRASASDLVSYMEPNREWQIQSIPNDPSWDLQWGPKKIEADWAWNITTGSNDVLVAIVDTGIDPGHPDLANNYVALGYDWVNSDANPMDDHGHGTHCAGIIAAVINNSVGVAGLAQVSIMAEKGLNRDGAGYTDWLANCIIHAVDQGADIISMSWGSIFNSKLMQQAIKYAYDNGVLLVAAAGNADTSAKLYPAGYDEVIAVSATRSNDDRAGLWNFGDWIEIAAPGYDIYSTMPTYHVTLNDYGFAMNYDYLSGTSMATPHVAGVAALVWSQFPNVKRDWVRMQLRYTADDVKLPGFDIYYGYGRLNARKAVEHSPPAHDLALYSWATPPYVEPEAMATINATTLNFGTTIESNVTIQLEVNGTIVGSEVVSSLNAGESITVSLTWNPTTTGRYNVTLSVTPSLNETRIDNNVVSKNIYVGKPYKAVVLDSEGNVCDYESRNWDKLNAEWHLYGSTLLYIDYTSLAKENITYADIAATKADVLIISSAWRRDYGWEFTDSEIDAIKQYVEEGHGIVITELSFFWKVPNNFKLASLVGINGSNPYGWYVTETFSLQMLEPEHPLFKGIPNPYYFPETTTGSFLEGVWNDDELSGGKYVAKDLWAQRSAIVVYKRGRTYISPWLEATEPYQHSLHLQLLYNAITWSPHELASLLEAPSYLLLGSSVQLNATASNIGITNETDVTLQLLMNGTVANSATISLLPAGESYILSYPWTPAEGVYNVTAYVQPVAGETYHANNSMTKIVRVTQNRDVAISQIISPSAVYPGKPFNITVVASNVGEFIETFNVDLYCNSTLIGTQTVRDLTPGTNVTTIFVWNTTGIQPCHNYTLWAEVKPVTGEINLENNVLVYGQVKVKMLGDVDGNGKIEIYDVVSVTSIYGKREGDPKWNSECDIVAPWGIINIYDVVVVTSNYGQAC